MGNPAVATITLSVIAALVVFGPHALIARATSRQRAGLFSRLIQTVLGKWLLAVYASLGLAVLLALAGGILLADTLGPPSRAWSPEKVFGTLLARKEPPAGTRGRFAGVLGSIRGDAETLQGASRNHPLPPGYLLQLSADAWQVSRFRKEPQSSGDSLGAAAQDLHAKARYAGEHPDNPFASVPIRAITRDEQGQEVQNREVRYCLKGLAAYDQRHQSFGHWSSPSSEPLPPGTYFLWARRPDYMLWANRRDGIGPRKELNVGADGGSGQEITLVSP